MNCALHFCESELVQFLNAGDYYINTLDISSVSSPCLVPVTYIDFFGRIVNVSVRHTLTFGILIAIKDLASYWLIFSSRTCLALIICPC